MEIGKLQTATQEYEQKQKNIHELLNISGELLDENFAAVKERNQIGELAQVKLSDEELDEEYHHQGEFLLSERPGKQTLNIHLLAADPYVNPHDPESVFAEYGPDAIAKFVHTTIDDDIEIADVYVVRQTPDGDYVLEKSIRDETLSNQSFETAKWMARINMGHAAAVGSAIETYMLDEHDRKEAAGAVMMEERQFGLYAASDDDLKELRKLLEEAEIE
jgi:hypothetical protein